LEKGRAINMGHCRPKRKIFGFVEPTEKRDKEKDPTHIKTPPGGEMQTMVFDQARRPQSSNLFWQQGEHRPERRNEGQMVTQ